MTDFNVAFIGAGNMARSIVGGLVASGHPADRIFAADTSSESLQLLRDVAPIVACDTNAAAAAAGDVVILAVKPQVMSSVCASIASELGAGEKLIISIAAGVSVSSLQGWLGHAVPMVRCMPNTPALLGCSASGLYASEQVTAQQRSRAQHIMTAVGIAVWLENEAELHAVTALSGSGPAYFFLFMEAMVASAVRLGLDRETAQRLTYQTCLGAARLAADGDADVGELRRRVTSPGGTTERAVASLETDALAAIIDRAIQAAHDRSVELSAGSA